jgi:hypothetical protein
LGERWRAVDEALKSGRLMQRTPSGAPLIPRKTVTDAAYGSLQRAWGRLSSAAKSGGAGLPKLAAQRAPAKAVKPVAVVADAKEASRITSFLKSPGFMAGAATFAVDGGMAVYRYWDGQANESELGEALQDAGVKAAAVGGAVQVLYVLAATPHGAVVAGVAIVTYAVTDAVISHFRDCAKRSVRIADLEGIAPASFLKNLPPALGEVPKEGAGSALP